MKIQLTKPTCADWRLVAIEASADEIIDFDRAAQATAYDANADNHVFRNPLCPDRSSVWDLRVDPFLAVYIAYETGKQLGIKVELDNIGDHD